MADTLPAIRPSSQWLRTSLLVGFIFILTWGCAIWYWRATDRVPDAAGLALVLLVLPLALIGAAQVGRTLISRSRPTAANTVQSVTTQAPVIEQQSHPTVTILATSVRVLRGTTAKEMAAAIAKSQVRPDVDKALLDSSGFPVMSQRSGDGVDETMQEEVSAWLAQNGIPAPQFSEEQWRALTLGTTTAGDLVSQAIHTFLPTEGEAPMLRLMPLLPTDWKVDQQRLASQWLVHAVAQCGWPASRITTDDSPIQSSISAAFSQLVEGSPSAHITTMIIACASNIGQETVAQWDANHMLFTPTNPHGQVPGEGAAGLLLTSAEQAQASGRVPGARFYLQEQLVDTDSGSRNKSDSSPVLRNLVETFAARLAVQLSDIPIIVTDAGEQPARVLEVMQLANTLMPQIDGSRDIVCAGTACGTCGAVPLIAAISLACHFAADRQVPVLCIGNDGPTRRSVGLIRPAESEVA
jgi:hypothetical protein